jgi:hypothetical protein
MSTLTEILLSPILLRNGCFAFDTFTAAEGLKQGFTYRRVDQAKYDRKATALALHVANGFVTVACETLDEFRARCEALLVKRSTARAVAASYEAVAAH